MVTPSRAAVLALLCAADLLVMLDGMVVTVALPAIERDLGTAQADLQRVGTAYTLSLGAFLLVGGRAGDLYGRRRAPVAGLVIFALASLAAGLASATGSLLAARAVQGLGAALAVPAALALLTAAFRQQREREQALGTLSATLAGGMVAGLVLGGVLTASLGWPWCFFLVVPFGLAAAALAPAVLEESRDEQAPRPDLPGAALCAAGCGMLVFGIVRIERTASPPRPSSSPRCCSSPGSWPSSGAPPLPMSAAGCSSCATGRWAPTSRSSRTPAASPA